MGKTTGNSSGKTYPDLNKLYIRPVLAFFLIVLASLTSHAFQFSDCDEVPVTLKMKHLGQTELPSIICANEVYFSVSGIFDFLKIKNSSTADFSRIEGFIADQHDTFIIDETHNTINYKGKNFPLEESDIINTTTGLFLKSEYFSEIFGLHNSFNVRFLAASLQTDIELPSIKAARRKEMRDNMQGLKNIFTADTTIQRDISLLNLGAANWNFNSTQRTDGFTYNRFNLGIGGLIAGGEFTGSLNYNTDQEFLARNQFYRWRYVNNKSNILRQITAGKIGARSISTIFNPVVGVQFTNAPTYIKKSFGTYLLSDYTQPEWIVELYINNALVDYVQADVNGFFSFDVPLMYGSTSLSLRYYGPWGEEEVSHKNISIPFNFLPAGEFEYLLSSGFVENGENSFFAQLRLDYGVSNRITMGAGVEFLSSLTENPYIPFFETSVRLPYNIMLSGQYLHEVGVKGNFTYVAPSNFRVDLNYIKYEKGQQVVPFSYLEERKANISLPLSIGRFSGTSRFILRQNLLQSNTFTNLEWLLSGRAMGFKLNITSTAIFNDFNEPLLFSRFSTSIRLPKKIILSPQVEYDYLNNRVNAIRAELRTQLSNKIHLQTSYDQNLFYNQFYLNLGITFEFRFSRIGLNSNTSKHHTSFSQSLGGNLLYEPMENHLRFDKRATIGRGSIKFLPYLDLNHNGKRDINEPPVDGLEVRSFGGGMKEKFLGGSTIFTGLESYINYHFKLETRNIDRIAWRVEKKSLNVYVNPNQMKVIEIPVEVVGEIAGYVYEEGGETGISGVKINIFTEKDKMIASIVSEADGFLNFMGLKSGKYYIKVDREQLKTLDLQVPNNYHFTIENGEDGAYLDTIKLFLNRRENQG